MRILLIDDKVPIVETVKRGIYRICGVEPAIDALHPTTPTWPYGMALPTTRDWDRYDVALVDLELFDPGTKHQCVEADLQGATHVLPYLRDEAPWLPVLGLSHLFESPLSAVHLTAGFGFDGHLPRGWFNETIRTKRDWEDVLDKALLSRRRAIMGRIATRPARARIKVESVLEHRLNGMLPGWVEVVGDCFRFLDEVALEELRPGFSGARVLRAIGRSVDAPRDGLWLVKIGSPYKLSREVRAHDDLRRSGFPFRLMAPLLWPGVVAKGGVAVVAYQFATGTATLAERFSGSSLTKDMKRVANLLKELYSGASRANDPKSDLLAAWCSRDRLNTAIGQLEQSRVKDRVSSLISSSEHPHLAGIATYTRAYAHGDLHAGNVMLGDQDVLIDFAWTRPGPVVSDMAKLAVDLAMKVPGLRSGTFAELANSLGMKGLLKGIVKPQRHDFELFECFLQLYLVEAITYEALTPADRAWISDILRSA